VKRFLSIFPFLERGAGDLRLGRLVANADFLRALLRWSSFDEIWLSGPSEVLRGKLEETLDRWRLPSVERVRTVSYAELPNLLREQRFEACHLGGWGYFMAGMHALRSRYAAFPFPITAPTHSLDGRTVFDAAVRLSHAGLLPQDAIFCSSNAARETMEALFRAAARIHGREPCCQLPILPLGVDPDLALGPSQGEGGETDGCATLRRRLRIANDRMVVLVPGRIQVATKADLHPLLAAWAGWRDQPPFNRAVLLLAGGAEVEDQSLIARQIRQFGLDECVRVRVNFSSQEKADLFRMATLVLSLADNSQETFGLTLLEAMLFAKPLVVSDWSGYRDLVEHGITGFLLPTYSSRQQWLDEWLELCDPQLAQMFQSQTTAVDLGCLQTHLCALLENPQLARTMGLRGQARCQARFLWPGVMAQYESYWNEAGEKSRMATVPVEPYYPSLGSWFSSFPSRWLQEEDRFLWVQGVCVPQPYEEMRPWLVESAMPALLSFGPRAFSYAQASQATGVSGLQLEPLIAWLLKNGCLRLQDPTFSPR
jgi:glycosyltransferase involved in cell wall biosynthesis